MKTQLSITILSLLLFGLNSCVRHCTNELESFSKTPFYRYFAFDESEWYLKSSSDSIKITNSYGQSQGNKHYGNEKCQITHINQGFKIHDVNYVDSTFSEQNDLELWVKFFDEEKLTYIDINQVDAYNASRDNILFQFPFNVPDSTEKVFYYFTNQLQTSNKTFDYVLTYEFNVAEPLQFIKRIHFAPEVGPVKIEMSDSTIYELYKAEAILASPSYF